MLVNDVLIDKEVENRISRAITSFGRLYGRAWNQKGLRLQTKLKAYKAVVLINGCETWTCYRRHIKALDRFHMKHLRNTHAAKNKVARSNN